MSFLDNARAFIANHERAIAITLAGVGILVTIYLYNRNKTSGSNTLATSGSAGAASATGLDSAQWQTIESQIAALAQNQSQQQQNMPSQTLANIRAASSPGGFNFPWDTKHTGVPLRSQDTGQSSILSYIPFGSQIQLIGSPVQGGLNQKGGSQTWYEALYNGIFGWISAADLSNFSVSGQPPGTPIVAPGPGGVNTNPALSGTRIAASSQGATNNSRLITSQMVLPSKNSKAGA